MIRSRTIGPSPLSEVMKSGPSWVQQRGPQRAGGRGDIKTGPWRCPRTRGTSPKMLQNASQVLLEVLDSPRTHPNGIGHRLRTTPTPTTVLTMGEFLSCRLDRRRSPTHSCSQTPGEAGTPDHHPTTPPTRFPVHYNNNPVDSDLSHRLRPQHLRSSPGVRSIRRVFPRLAH